MTDQKMNTMVDIDMNDPRFPFLFRPENVARYENGTVWILDRRIYPFEMVFVECPTYEETACAIEDMVTQSGGPSKAAGYGMAQAGRAADDLSSRKKLAFMEQAAERLINTRETQNMIRDTVNAMLTAARAEIESDQPIEVRMLAMVREAFQQRHDTGMALGRNGADLLEDGDVVLNHCWAESGIIYTMFNAQLQGKKISAICSETRPYLQGARLTADAIADMGIPTTVVTDGMPAFLMSQGKISKFMTGADRITMSGHVVNKIGTFQHALSAHHFGIPFYPFCWGPDKQAPTPESVVIEYRDPEEVVHCLGVRSATPKAQGLYPAFDITPPEFVSAMVTDKGVFSPYTIGDYYR